MSFALVVMADVGEIGGSGCGRTDKGSNTRQAHDAQCAHQACGSYI